MPDSVPHNDRRDPCAPAALSGHDRPLPLFVHGLAPSATLAELRQLFEPFGQLAEPFWPFTSRRVETFFFIAYESRVSALRAIAALDGCSAYAGARFSEPLSVRFRIEGGAPFRESTFRESLPTPHPLPPHSASSGRQVTVINGHDAIATAGSGSDVGAAHVRLTTPHAVPPRTETAAADNNDTRHDTVASPTPFTLVFQPLGVGVSPEQLATRLSRVGAVRSTRMGAIVVTVAGHAAPAQVARVAFTCQRDADRARLLYDELTCALSLPRQPLRVTHDCPASSSSVRT